MVEKLLKHSEQHNEYREHALLFLMAYAFLLRVPSEGIPVVAGGSDSAPSLTKEGEKSLVLRLPRRKNKPMGSRLVRGCWCKESAATCPLHVLGPWLANTPAGSRLFPNVTPTSALATLRGMLKDLEVENARLYRTHDFRRGHAKDLQLAGEFLIHAQIDHYESWLCVS